MYEIFIVLILGSYYLIKYSWLRARDVTSEALEIKRDEDYNRRLNKWESAVTDLEMEKKIRKAVTTLDSLEEYKEEIESVLENEFGIKREDLNYNDFLNVFRGELEDYAKLLFARILMGNRGRLLKCDIYGLTLRGGICPEQRMAFWINKKLQERGVYEKMYLMGSKKYSDNIYYQIKSIEDIEFIEKARKRPEEIFGYRYIRNETDKVMWEPTIYAFCFKTAVIKPISKYVYWRRIN